MQDPFLMDLLDRPIAFQRAFVRIGAGIGGALMLSQAVYWSKRTRDNEGWFYKSQTEWEEETGMTRREQESARRGLKAAGVLEEKKQGIPAKLYYRVNTSRIADAISGNIEGLSVEDVIANYKSVLTNLSKAGLMRAKRADVDNEMVNYADVLRQHGLVCACCNKPITRGVGQFGGALQFDHKTPISEGGGHVFDNIFPTHAECNLSKGVSDLCMSSQDNLVRLDETDSDAYAKQSITENTAENTSENKTPLPDESGEDEKPPADPEPEAETIDQAFDRFWKHWPNKKVKKVAKEKFLIKLKESKQPVSDFVDMLIDDVERRKAAGQYGFQKLYAERYFKYERWTDEVGDPDSGQHASGRLDPLEQFEQARRERDAQRQGGLDMDQDDRDIRGNLDQGAGQGAVRALESGSGDPWES